MSEEEAQQSPAAQIDEKLAESARLLEDMDRMMQRARVLILDQKRLIAVLKQEEGGGEQAKDQQ